MSDHDCFVEFRAGFADHDVVLLAGDRVAMQWLARQLRSSRAFTVGIAGPFESVAGVTLTGVGSERRETRIVRDGARFRWILSRHSRDAYAARAEALYSGAGGGHQYLDADTDGPVTVVLSLGEGYRPGGMSRGANPTREGRIPCACAVAPSSCRHGRQRGVTFRGRRTMSRAGRFVAMWMATVMPAAAAAEGFYIGAAIGGTQESSDYAEQVARVRASDPGGPPTDVWLRTDHGAAGRVFGGFVIAPHFSIEADYADLGRLDAHAIWHGVPPFYQFERFTQIDVRAFGISLLASAPIAQRLSLFGRAGAAFTRVDYQTHGTVFVQSPDGGAPGMSPSPTPPELHSHKTRPLLALGLDYRFADRWSVRGEWARYFDVGDEYGEQPPYQELGKFDLDLFTVGVTYSF